MGLTDAAIAAQLVARDPSGMGGLWVRGQDEEKVIAQLGDKPWARLPATVDRERLNGGLDVAATLAAGRPVRRPGILAEARGQLLVVTGAERVDSGIAGLISSAMDEGGPALLLLDRGVDDDAPPPAALTERLAFHLIGPSFENPECTSNDPIGEDEAAQTIAEAANALGIRSARADLFALRAARAHAALRGTAPDEAALAFAARTVLAARATRLPVPDEQPEREPSQDEQRPRTNEALQDVVLEAVKAALPAALLASLLDNARGQRSSASQGKGARQASGRHGRVIGARRGKPGSGARLAILDTLRAAAPWQRVRGRTGRVLLARDDLRIRRHESRSGSLTVFAVDASGSAAAQRLAEAKGAVEALLEQSYVRRAEVALVAIRGTGATLLLPPTRSLARARRLLAELPGGGGTPLAAGIDAARELALAAPSRGRTPSLVLLTDGRANITLAGKNDRSEAAAEAEAAARRVALAGLSALVIDIGPRARPEAAALARTMAGRYLHLPLADQGAVGRAVTDLAA